MFVIVCVLPTIAGLSNILTSAEAPQKTSCVMQVMRISLSEPLFLCSTTFISWTEPYRLIRKRQPNQCGRPIFWRLTISLNTSSTHLKKRPRICVHLQHNQNVRLMIPLISWFRAIIAKSPAKKLPMSNDETRSREKASRNSTDLGALRRAHPGVGQQLARLAPL